MGRFFLLTAGFLLLTVGLCYLREVGLAFYALNLAWSFCLRWKMGLVFLAYGSTCVELGFGLFYLLRMPVCSYFCLFAVLGEFVCNFGWVFAILFEVLLI